MVTNLKDADSSALLDGRSTVQTKCDFTNEAHVLVEAYSVIRGTWSVSVKTDL